MGSTRSIKVLYLALFPLSFAVVAWLDHATGGTLARWIPLKCPIHFLTGWHCPTCGLTRSVIATWRGDFAVAWAFHFAGPLLLLCGLALWVFAAEAFLRRLPLRRLRFQISGVWIWTLVAAYVVWGLTRTFPTS